MNFHNLTVKQLVTNKTVKFAYFRKNELWYNVDGFLFPVPVSDTGDGTFQAEDSAIYFMRYIRTHLKKCQDEQIVGQSNNLVDGYILNAIARDSWSGPEYWYQIFESKELRAEFLKRHNEERAIEYKANKGQAPDYYVNYEINDVRYKTNSENFKNGQFTVQNL